MKKLNKILKKIGMIAPAAALGIFAFLSFDHFQEGKKHRKEYGTRESPAYQITADVPKNTKYLTYFSTFSIARERENNKLVKRIEELTELSTELYPLTFKRVDKLEESISSLESRLSQEEKHKEDSDNIRAMYNAIRTTFEDIHHISTLITVDSLSNFIYSSVSNTEELSRDFDIAIANLAYDKPSEKDKDSEITKRSKELFKKITGKEWPSNLDINIKEIEDEKVAGNYSHILGKIKSEKRSYPRTLGIIMHEAGHAASQHDEQDFYDSLNLLTARINQKRETNIIEEAAAYAFQIASAYYEEKEISQEMIIEELISQKSLIESYFNSDNEIHREAAALAESAVEYFQCPKKAFNYLATTRYENVDPKIREIIEKAKEQYRLNPIYKDQIKEYTEKAKGIHESLKSKLESLEARISALEAKLPGPKIDWEKAMKSEKTE